MNSENKHNDLQEILTQALEDLKNELGEKFDISKVNLAELERRTGISRSKLRTRKAGFYRQITDRLKGMLRNGILVGVICQNRDCKQRNSHFALQPMRYHSSYAHLLDQHRKGVLNDQQCKY